MQKKLIHQGNLISLFEEPVNLRNGGTTSFDIVKHPGGAVIGAFNSEGELCLLKQWRHALQKTIWELPAGCLEPNEPPEETAKRELEEEAGVSAAHWESLGVIAPSPGFSNELLYLFLAQDLSSGQIKLDDAEQLEAHWVSPKKLHHLVTENEIIDAKTLAFLFRLQQLRPSLLQF